jgi:hypothetical protein
VGLASVQLPEWLAPGCRVTLVWVDGGPLPGHGGSRLYHVAGPLLEDHPETGCFLLAPAERDTFAESAYRGEATAEDLRALLASCTVARGRLSDARDTVAVHDEVPALPLLDAWRLGPAGEVLSYLPEIDGVLTAGGFLRLTAGAHRRVQEGGETLATAWVCEECGDPRDDAVLVWTAPSPMGIRACLVVEITGGVWRCRLHPFDLRAPATDEGA